MHSITKSKQYLLAHGQQHQLNNKWFQWVFVFRVRSSYLFFLFVLFTMGGNLSSGIKTCHVLPRGD